jgi:hypothetical protein
MDRSSSSSFFSWTSCLLLIFHAHDFLNLLHNLEILCLFSITFQAFPRGYGSRLIVHLVLVRYSTTYSSSYFHDLLDPVFLHHDWIQGLLLLPPNFLYQSLPPFIRLLSLLPPFSLLRTKYQYSIEKPQNKYSMP